MEPETHENGAKLQAGGGDGGRSRPKCRSDVAGHRQRAPSLQQTAVGGSQLPARCGQLDRGRRKLYPRLCRPAGREAEGRGEEDEEREGE